MIELSAKKKFLSWVIQCIPLKRKEAYWMLNYLLKHEALLQHVTFVEKALSTPRGILITDHSIAGLGLEMRKGNKLIEDSQEIYSELRNNKKDELYLEINFVERESSYLYSEIIEEHGYQETTQEEQNEFFDSLDAFLAEEEIKLKKRNLQQAIDLALENNDRDTFIKLTTEYVALDEKRD